MATKPPTPARESRAQWLQRLRAEYSHIFGAVYLNHFEIAIGNPENPRGTAGHYTGFVEGLTDAEIEQALAERQREHGTDAGAKIMRAVAEKGVRWQVAKIITHTRKVRELDLKERYKNARRWCPICRGEIALGDEPVVIDDGQQPLDVDELPSPSHPDMYAMFARHARNRREGAQLRELPADWDQGLL